MCDSWRHSFKQFIDDMGSRPKGHQIDRIDVNGNYEPLNCRWVLPVTNSRNKRDTIYVWHCGMKLDLMTACQMTGRSHRAISRRAARSGYKRSWQDVWDQMDEVIKPWKYLTR
jgi:hypothetical protein